jgi:hypothetical protein
VRMAGGVLYLRARALPAVVGADRTLVHTCALIPPTPKKWTATAAAQVACTERQWVQWANIAGLLAEGIGNSYL